MIKCVASRYIWVVLVKHLMLFCFYDTATCVKVHDGRESCFINVTHDKTDNLISEWWRKNDVVKQLECKYNIQPHYTHKLFDTISAPAIRSFPCAEGSDPPRYHYTGTIKGGRLEGQGILVFITEQEWSEQSHSDKTREESVALNNTNVCFETGGNHDLRIREVIGTFRKGALHGPARITYTDEAITIGSYNHGKPHGFIRNFNAERRLVHIGGFEMGWEVGYHWKLRSGHLLYQNRDMINENISKTIVFPISDDGLVQKPMLGDYFPLSGALENIKQIELIRVSSNVNCILQIAYEVLSNENYSYALSSKSKHPLFGQIGHSLLCNINHEKDFNNPTKKLENWFRSINSMMKGVISEDGSITHDALKILWHLRPLSDQLDIDHSTRLISSFNFDLDAKSITAKIFNSIPVDVSLFAADVKLDKNLKLNGFNDVIVTPKHQHFVPRDNTLGWSPTRIIGTFNHGELNGFVKIHTNMSTVVWATVKKGILHGPFFIMGLTYIIEPVSCMMYDSNYETILLITLISYYHILYTVYQYTNHRIPLKLVLLNDPSNR